MSEATIEDIERVCRYWTTNAEVGRYFGISADRVASIRSQMSHGKQSGPAVIKPEDPGLPVTTREVICSDKTGRDDHLIALLEYGRRNGGCYLLSAEVCDMRLNAMTEYLR